MRWKWVVMPALAPLAALPAAAETWHTVYNSVSSGQETYADSDSIRRTGDKVVLTMFDAPTTNTRYKQVAEVDCASGRYRLVGAKRYDVDGADLGAAPFDGEWRPFGRVRDLRAVACDNFRGFVTADPFKQAKTSWKANEIEEDELWSEDEDF